MAKKVRRLEDEAIVEAKQEQYELAQLAKLTLEAELNEANADSWLVDQETELDARLDAAEKFAAKNALLTTTVDEEEIVEEDFKASAFRRVLFAKGPMQIQFENRGVKAL